MKRGLLIRWVLIFASICSVRAEEMAISGGLDGRAGDSPTEGNETKLWGMFPNLRQVWLDDGSGHRIGGAQLNMEHNFSEVVGAWLVLTISAGMLFSPFTWKMMKRIAFTFVFCFAMVSFAAGAGAISLPQLQSEAQRVSPDLQSVARQIEAARAAGRQAGRLTNPTLSIFADQKEQEIALRQTFDVWGKLPLAREIAMTDAETTEARLSVARLDLHYEVARQFWTLAGAERRSTLLESELADWRKLFAIREGELKAGEIATSDLLTVQSLAAQRRQERWKLATDTATSRIALNVLTGRNADAPLSINADSKSQSVPAASGRDAIKQALAAHPLLVQARARLTAAGFRVRQEQRRWLPDPTVGPFARNTPEDTLVGFTLSFSLPVFDRNRDGIRSAVASEAAVQQEIGSAERSIAQEAFTAFQLRAQALGAFEELNDLLTGPAAGQLALAEESLKLGAISERDLLVARIDYSQRQQELAALRVQVGLANARLSRSLAQPKR